MSVTLAEADLVADGTLAQQKGIKVGMVLLAVNGESVKGISKDGAMEIVMRYANTTRRLTFTNEPLTLAEVQRVAAEAAAAAEAERLAAFEAEAQGVAAQ